MTSTHETNGATTTERPTAEEAEFVRLYDAGFWPIAIYPQGYTRKSGGKDVKTSGKEPIGKAWGIDRWTKDKGRQTYRSFTGAGVGVALGPGRAPDGGWLIDAEVDGEGGEESILRLFGGEVLETMSWRSARGPHRLFQLDGDRLQEILGRLTACERKDKPGVYHLTEYPGLELRFGGVKADGTVKQIQSVTPPTCGRRWDEAAVVAGAPEAFYTALEQVAASKVQLKVRPDGEQGNKSSPILRATSGATSWLRKALENASGRAAIADEGHRHNTLRDETNALAGYLHYHERYGVGYSEQDLIDKMTEAGRRAHPERADLTKEVRDYIAYGKARPLKLKDELHAEMCNGDGHHGPGHDQPGDASEEAQPGDEGYVDPPPNALPLVTIGRLVTDNPRMRPVLIDGLLREGETLNIIAASKVGKSWMIYALLIAVATGRRFLGFDTTPGKVLLIDNELHAETIAHRLPKVCDALGVPFADVANQIEVLPLRGQLQNLHALYPGLIALGRYRFKFIVVDAFYRALPAGTEENSNGDITALYNLTDSIAAKTGAGVGFVHHASKGDQSGKAVTDVGSGAGSQSRAADTHLVLRPHEEKDVVVLEAAVRSFPPVDPICLRWTYPTWAPAPELDPGLLRKPGPRKRQAAGDGTGKEKQEQREADDKAVMVALDKVDPDGRGYGIEQIRKVTGLTRSRMTDAITRLVVAGIIKIKPVSVVAGKGAMRTADGIVRNEDTGTH